MDPPVTPTTQHSLEYKTPYINSPDHDINVDFEENSSHEEGIIDEVCQ